jgi:hypothetical protein
MNDGQIDGHFGRAVGERLERGRFIGPQADSGSVIAELEAQLTMRAVEIRRLRLWIERLALQLEDLSLFLECKLCGISHTADAQKSILKIH